MATLKERIQTELGDAMRSKDETRKSALRMLIAAIKNAEIEAGGPLDDDGVVVVAQKQAKQRRESIVEFQKGGRQDLVDKEAAELAILQVYLPPQASHDEIEAAARRIIAESGATTARDLGKVMPGLMKEFAGKADGRELTDLVRGLLSG